MLYFTLRPLKKVGRTFNFIFGGRGTGKTFNSIYEDYEDRNIFVYARRKQTEIDLLGSNNMSLSMNPFEQINLKKGTEMSVEKLNKNIWGVFDGYEDNKRHIGYMMAMTTIGNIRGFSGDIIQDILYDEFIPQKNDKAVKDESGMFFNAYETINRNRELDGLPPVRCYLMTNSNVLKHPLLEDLNLIPKIERMQKKKQTFIDLPDRDCTITMIDNAEFKEKKKKTALYKLTQGTKYYEMAIENSFAYEDFSNIKSLALQEFTPVCAISGITIYKHKSESFYYVSPHYQKCETFKDTQQDRIRFTTYYSRPLYLEYEHNNVFFENYVVKTIFLEVINA